MTMVPEVPFSELINRPKATTAKLAASRVRELRLRRRDDDDLVLREAEAGLPVKELCRKHGFSEASYYLWRSKFGGMSVSDAKRLKELETENTRLKKLLAESLLEIEVTREVLRKKW